MPKDTLTIALRGEVLLSDFAGTIWHFSDLVQTLSTEIAGPVEIDWEITRLDTGSAIAEVVGLSREAEMVEKVVQAFSTVVKALENRTPIPYSYEVEKAAKALTSVINGKIHSIELWTDEVRAVITEAWKEEDVVDSPYSFSAIEGTVETLSSRYGLRFTLYDALFDKAVHCYLENKQREMLRNVWGKRVVVVGRVRRDQDNGRPIEIRDIKSITPKENLPPYSYRRALGAIPWEEGDELPEDIIRRLRDGE